ncbi:10087_t:CDS:2 [Acaulospora colombiana]|uniref:10087_t:CDS:1 n=1 Tax=Acaulospora colombiana TaxID=27376 RepID=A0ACA9KW48_9GLOM|nr:10087_t:CDS:2 [Acaulospora colombiana]
MSNGKLLYNRSNKEVKTSENKPSPYQVSQYFSETNDEALDIR